MLYFLGFIGVMVIYFSIRIWWGSKKMEFYGDSIKKRTSNSREQAYEKSAQHSQQLINRNNHTGGGGPTG